MNVQPVVAVRFCPVLFELGEVAGSDLKASIDLPYRMVFAMATKDSVLIYDTQVGQDISIYVLSTPIKNSQLGSSWFSLRAAMPTFLWHSTQCSGVAHCKQCIVRCIFSRSRGLSGQGFCWTLSSIMACCFLTVDTASQRSYQLSGHCNLKASKSKRVKVLHFAIWVSNHHEPEVMHQNRIRNYVGSFLSISSDTDTRVTG